VSSAGRSGREGKGRIKFLEPEPLSGLSEASYWAGTEYMSEISAS